jgi:hypothetical protein
LVFRDRERHLIFSSGYPHDDQAVQRGADAQCLTYCDGAS